MSRKKPAFVVLVFPDTAQTGWCATVMCTHRPMVALGPRGYASTLARVRQDVRDTCKLLPPGDVDLVQIETDADTAPFLEGMGPAWVMDNLTQVKRKEFQVTHTIFTPR
ncbi:hypothetical protein [Allokutzneria oryzae]|uniref:Uncharacterized protein n=1 Tax=Allokutzneria oryzae TaxID=1378989 RepID=A0ABV5ZZF7_9PSEU